MEAQKEAIEMGHSYVGTEHILLAILKQDSPLGESLGEMGVTYARAKNEIISMVGMGMRGYSSSPQMTPRAKRVIELAYEEAKYLAQADSGRKLPTTRFRLRC
ncbi:MAG: ATPase AAA-2 domain protein [Thermotoga sp. 50_1627]|nr:MAG: ATPase AAA-2 domain protein [Thermotoga sp. 50_1627]